MGCHFHGWLLASELLPSANDHAGVLRVELHHSAEAAYLSQAIRVLPDPPKRSRTRLPVEEVQDLDVERESASVG
jgi:hypothetical protein